MIEVRRSPADRCVTIVAGIIGIQVSRVFTDGCNAVMTRAAGANDLGVIDRKHGREHVGSVAVLANIAGLDVRLVFAGRFCTVVAADAIAADICVVEIRRQPADRRVAVVAIIAARYMRRMLAGCRGAVVARATGPQYLRMVDGYHRFEGGRAVAVFTDIGGLYVGRALAGCCRTVMAAHAIVSDACVIKNRWLPCAYGMAVVAFIIGSNVRWRLTSRLYSIVATATASRYG